MSSPDDAPAERFRRSEVEKERRLQRVRARLTVSAAGAGAGASRRGVGGWFVPALIWVAIIVVASWAASYWLGPERGAKRTVVVNGERLELQRGRSGHYEIGGALQGQAVVFMVDTGASLTSISGELGSRLGIQRCAAIGFDLSAADQPGCCRPERFSTANGDVEGCVARVPSLRFGGFEVRNAEVAVMPGLGPQALLGMNVLKHFHLEQRQGRLAISAGDGGAGR